MATLRIHYLQHVPFEGLGCMEDWVKARGHILTSTHLYEDTNFPHLKDFDWLIIMGGTMGVYDENEYDWLTLEKQFIKAAIENGKIILGICLGAQLIASALGATVEQHSQKEIGWFPITKINTKNSSLFAHFPDKFTAFHWHGDIFEIPANATHLFDSEACNNQGFVLYDKIIGLQFHPEVTEKYLQEMITEGDEELVAANYVQTAQEILANKGFAKENNERLFLLLDKMEKLK